MVTVPSGAMATKTCGSSTDAVRHVVGAGLVGGSAWRDDHGRGEHEAAGDAEPLQEARRLTFST